ncbi:MAG TPA: TldD/PmbA family protein [Kofleriaceae bacterium]|nr:TldD/PmbA family protein [Kofleriaceae bacterium]
MSAEVTLENVAALRALAAETVELARKAGADDVEVLVHDGSELSASVRLGEPELVQEAGSRGLGLRLQRGGRCAITYTSDLRRDALVALCAETVALAELAEPDDAGAPPDPSELAKDVPDLDLYDPEVGKVDAAWALRQALEGEDAARAYDPRVSNSEGATWARVIGVTAFATSGGFVGGYRSSYASLVVQPLCDDPTDPTTVKKRNGHWWTASRFLAELEPADEVGREAARRTVRTIGSRKVETQECPVVFDAEVARSLLGSVFSVANGSSFWRKSSYLLGREGQSVASELFTLVDDPLRPRGPGSRPFDGDGLPTRRNVLIDRGVLTTVLCDVYSGRKLGRRSTGSAGRSIGGSPGPTTSNLILSAGTQTLAELLAPIRSGLFVTQMMGMGFNPVTGDFSRGAIGFWIENGELTFPVSEITIAANFDDILHRIDGVANDLRFRSSVASPSLRVSHMMVAGTSK